MIIHIALEVPFTVAKQMEAIEHYDHLDFSKDEDDASKVARMLKDDFEQGLLHDLIEGYCEYNSVRVEE